MLAYSRYVCGYGYVGKAFAILKCADADGLKLAAFRKGYGRKVIWVRIVHGKRILANRRYACGNVDAGKAGAMVERSGADGLKLAAFRKNYACKAGALLECINADRRYTCGECYADKAGATVEHVIADRRYTCGECYADKVGAT